MSPTVHLGEGGLTGSRGASLGRPAMALLLRSKPVRKVFVKNTQTQALETTLKGDGISFLEANSISQATRNQYLILAQSFAAWCQDR